MATVLPIVCGLTLWMIASGLLSIWLLPLSKKSNNSFKNIPINTKAPAFFGKGRAHWIFNDNMAQSVIFFHPGEVDIDGEAYVPMTIYMHLELSDEIKIDSDIQVGDVVGKIAESK